MADAVSHPPIMPGLAPGIIFAATKEDGRVKPGHDDVEGAATV